ncbi:Meckel syndrome type 1 protein-like isoform X1 [Oncorhynchus tshawytscha]|uniref:Meckel syndrome type 1 protein-like isoform X1 n=1 Tax=Oncorhynchus tshawytscha TaxID=74940 RepID=UPI001C3D59A6|nr:Meckel syndrome type 1 protein-like isoform X1 [Oncorhynchus tshawytscha]
MSSLQHSQSMVTQVKSNPTLLAHRMANVRHRRQDRHPVDRTIPKSRLITWDPSEDFVKTSHMVNTPVQTIHIMGNLGPAGKLGQKEKECLLCTIRADGNGVVTIKPDFNKGKVETEGEKREVWRQTRGDGTATVHI